MSQGSVATQAVQSSGDAGAANALTLEERRRKIDEMYQGYKTKFPVVCEPPPPPLGGYCARARGCKLSAARMGWLN